MKLNTKLPFLHILDKINHGFYNKIISLKLIKTTQLWTESVLCTFAQKNIKGIENINCVQFFEPKHNYKNNKTADEQFTSWREKLAIALFGLEEEIQQGLKNLIWQIYDESLCSPDRVHTCGNTSECNNHYMEAPAKYINRNI
jgi:hypothetical protein